MKTTTPIWTPSADFGFASCHLAWGALIWLFAGMHFSWLVASLILLGFAAPKEFVFDLIVEKDTVSDSTVDFLWYMAGGLLGWLLWLTF
jgi:hypothetical protein